MKNQLRNIEDITLDHIFFSIFITNRGIELQFLQKCNSSLPWTMKLYVFLSKCLIYVPSCTTVQKLKDSCQQGKISGNFFYENYQSICK